jgi:hypothetical protein
MRYAALSLMLASLAATAAGTEGPPFFDGKSLDGWEGLTQYWKVQDGAIVGSTAPDGIKFNTFLCSKREYGDFELSFQVRLKGPTANSGVQIRSRLVDPKTFAVHGPQCDMGQEYWGSLFGEHFGPNDQHYMMKASPKDRVRQVLKPDDFNDYAIRAAGKHVTIRLNGLTTVDDDFPELPAKGIIAWQIHAGGPMEVTFRRIEFKEKK